MQLAAAQLANHLQKGVRPLYTLHGDEPLLQQEAADAIRAAARAQGYTERTVHTVAGAHFDWSAVLAAGSSLSLFADKQIVEVRIPSGKPGKDGSAALQQLADSAAGNDSTLTLVLLPRLDKQTKSGAWFTALDGAGATVQIDSIERAAPCWRRWSRIRRRTTCDGVTSCDAHSASNAFFLEGSMSTVSRAVFCSRLRIRVGLNLHSNEHVIQRCIHRAWRPTQRRQA